MSTQRAQALNAIVLLWLLVLFVVAASQLQNDYFVKVIMLIGMNVVLAVSLALASGFTGVFSLGQIGFMAIGAYASALLTIPPSAKPHALLPGLPTWLAELDLLKSIAGTLNSVGLSEEAARAAIAPARPSGQRWLRDGRRTHTVLKRRTPTALSDRGARPSRALPMNACSPRTRWPLLASSIDHQRGGRLRRRTRWPRTSIRRPFARLALAGRSASAASARFSAPFSAGFYYPTGAPHDTFSGQRQCPR